MKARWAVPSACWFGVAALLESNPLRAQASDGPDWELDWRAPAACEERERTLETVERLLGASPRERAETLWASAIVTRTASGDWHLTLDVSHGGERLSRQLSGRSCAELSDAAALILALVLDPELLARSAPATEKRSNHRRARPLSPRPSSPPRPAVRSQRQRLRSSAPRREIPRHGRYRSSRSAR
ncbi:MAG: hypothetical protein QM756_44110 [Polyangiaceae bacterium]